jgi:hypothetical protein
MYYTLYNETTKTYLKHPRVGLWFTDKEEEGKKMYEACDAYIKSLGVNLLISLVKFSDENELSDSHNS